MVNNQLRIVYDQIFEQVSPQITNQGRGVLYDVMHTILYAEESRCKEICNYLDIKISATLDDDKRIVDGVISNPNDSFNPINLLRHDPERELFWIVVIACTLAGVYSCYKYLKYTNEQKAIQKTTGSTKSSQTAVSSQQLVTPPRQSLTAALCLVVSASAIGNLRKNGQINVNVSDIEKLIDAASYFLCTEAADSNQLDIETTDEDIPTDSNLEVYVKIYIDEGQEMIGKKVPYILKRNLPSHGQGVVKQLACLRNLSALEKFNRV